MAVGDFNNATNSINKAVEMDGQNEDAYIL